MDPENVILSEVSQIEKEKYHMTFLVCGIWKENDTNELLYKTKLDWQTWRTNLWYQGEGCGESIARELGMDMYTLLY